MPSFPRHIAVLSILALMLGGCDESLDGAYQASIQHGEEEPSAVGLAVILPDRIIADRQTVEVDEWMTEGELTTAYGQKGERIIQLQKVGDGVLIQSLPRSRVIYTKIDL